MAEALFGAPQPEVLVTGAAGFIGGAVARALGSQGVGVRAGVRRPTGSAAGPVDCDLDRPEQVAAAVDGTAVVVHAAYGDEHAMVRQCAGLLDAMTRAGVANLVYFSSIAVYGEREGFVTEEAGPVGALDRYGAAKRDCEALISAWAREPAAEPRRAVIFRPGIVYGSGSRFWVEKLAARIEAGAWGTFGVRGKGVAALVHVDDVAEVTAMAVTRLIGDGRAGLQPVETVHLVGPEAPTWNAYFQSIAARTGLERLREIGSGELGARVALGVLAKTGRRVKLPLPHAWVLAPGRGELALFSRKAIYSSDRAQALFGHGPTIGLEAGLARTNVPSQDTRPRP